MDTTTIILLVLLVVVIAIVVFGIVAMRNRPRVKPSEIPSDPASADWASPAAGSLTDAPMTGLESALEAVTDRSGRPIREHLDAETTHVDELRVPDDTGPLLRRALDHVSGADENATSENAPTSVEPNDSAS